MNSLDVLKSRGVAFLVVLFALVDVLILFIAKGIGSFVAILVMQLICILYYVIARSVSDVDEPFVLFKGKDS